jgi:hypothetical protein
MGGMAAGQRDVETGLPSAPDTRGVRLPPVAAKRIRRHARRILREARAERRAERRRRTSEREAARRERRLAERARRHERELGRRRLAKLAREFGSVGRRRPRLSGIAEVRAFLRTNTTPVFVVSPTPFNLLGLDRWVHDLYFLAWYDPFDGAHPRVFAPSSRGWRAFDSIDEINRALLGHPDVAAFVAGKGPGGRALLLTSDPETERLAVGLGLEVLLPSEAIRSRIAAALGAGGRPKHPASRSPDAAVGADRRWPRRLTFAGVATARGSAVGPLTTELVGIGSLTPIPGGHCGTEMWAGAVTERTRRRSRRLVRRAGDRLAKLGYRGAFEAVVTLDGDRPRIAEVRPRVGALASLTNASAGAYADVPLLCLHLLERLGIDYRLDLPDIRARWADAEIGDPWTQLVMKDLDDRVQAVTAAPPTGIWRMSDDGAVAFDRPALDWHGLLDESEAFVMRLLGTGDFRYRGVDLATVVLRGRARTEDGELDERGRAWVEALRATWSGIAVAPSDLPSAAAART